MVDAATQSVNTQYLPPSYLDGNGELKAGISKDKAAEVSQGIQARVSTMSQDERVVFMALVKSPDFAPDASTSVEDVQGTLANLENVADLLSQTTNANAARILGRILVELGAQQRQEALDSRLLARSTARAELVAGADKLRDASSDLRDGAQKAMVTAAITSGVAIAAAGAGGVAGGMAMGTASKGMSTAGQAATKAVDGMDDAAVTATKSLEAANKTLIGNKAGGIASIGQSFAAGGGAAGTIGGAVSQQQSATGQADSQLDQAEGSELQAEAEVTRSEGELEANEQQALQEFVNQMIQFLKEMRDAEVEQMAVVTRG